jgi:hypothetical protein
MPISRRNILKSIALGVPALQLNPAALGTKVKKTTNKLSLFLAGYFYSVKI